MATDKSTYDFTFQLPAETIQSVVQSWLSANGFTLHQDKNGSFYRSGDMVISGYRFFEYNITGNRLIIQAYVGNRWNKLGLDNGMLGAMNTIPYKNSLESLLKELNRLENGNGMQQTMNPQLQGDIGNSQVALQQFQDKNEKNKETCAIVSFCISLLGLLISFCGMYGGILLVLEILLAVMGLKSSKKGFAIAAIIIGVVSFFVAIISTIYWAE